VQLGERPGPVEAVGMALIVGALALLSVATMRARASGAAAALVRRSPS